MRSAHMRSTKLVLDSRAGVVMKFIPMATMCTDTISAKRELLLNLLSYCLFSERNTDVSVRKSSCRESHKVVYFYNKSAGTIGFGQLRNCADQ